MNKDTFKEPPHKELEEHTLEAIRQRVQAATPGQWFINNPEITILDEQGGSLAHIFTKEVKAQSEKDARFLACAREDILLLLNEIDRLKTELKNAI